MCSAGWLVSRHSWHVTLDLIKKNVPCMPILVTECGVSQQHSDYTSTITQEKAMENVLNAISCHPEVVGVLVWTLIDNIEWEMPDVHFGVFDHDRNKTKLHGVVEKFFRARTGPFFCWASHKATN